MFTVHNVKPYDTPCDSHAAFDTDGQKINTSSLCHQIMLVQDASDGTLHSCLGARAKLGLHHSHCSLVLPVQCMNNIGAKQANALLQPVDADCLRQC